MLSWVREWHNMKDPLWEKVSGGEAKGMAPTHRGKPFLSQTSAQSSAWFPGARGSVNHDTGVAKMITSQALGS